MLSANETLTIYTATQAADSVRRVRAHEVAHSSRETDRARTDDGAAIRAKHKGAVVSP